MPWQRHSAEDNEQNIVTVEGEGHTVIFKQIAGLIARRIVFTKKVGDQSPAASGSGMIKFGSRVDVLSIPASRSRSRSAIECKAARRSWPTLARHSNVGEAIPAAERSNGARAKWMSWATRDGSRRGAGNRPSARGKHAQGHVHPALAVHDCETSLPGYYAILQMIHGASGNPGTSISPPRPSALRSCSMDSTAASRA